MFNWPHLITSCNAMNSLFSSISRTLCCVLLLNLQLNCIIYRWLGIHVRVQKLIHILSWSSMLLCLEMCVPHYLCLFGYAFFLCWCSMWTPLLSSSAGAYGRWPMSQPGHTIVSGAHMLDYITVQKVCWASLSSAGSIRLFRGGNGALSTIKWFACVFGLSSLLPADSPGPAGLFVSACSGGKDLIIHRKTWAAYGC